MRVIFQQATRNDVPTIVQLLALVWPNQSANLEQVTTALATPGHVSYLALIHEQIVGLVSSFPTVSSDGQVRWEVDLLAVHPAYRGQQFGQHLVQRSTAEARVAQAQLARALVATDNHASQRTFAAVGYCMHPERVTLYINSYHAFTQLAPGIYVYCIPVHTLLYSGAWLEGSITMDTVQAACAQQVEQQWSTLGLLVPQHQPRAHDIVRQADFACVGDYHWWSKPC